MKHHLILRLLLFFMAPGMACAQTVIDLNRGGLVRSKTIDDYKEEAKMTERLRADSLEYVDCLRRGFNALHDDSLAAGEALFEKALKLRPAAPGNYIVRHTLAGIAAARGNYPSAHQLYSRVLKEQPEYAPSRAARASVALRLGMAREAVADVDAVMALKPAERAPYEQEARFVRAAARYELHLYADALADLALLLRNEPQHVGGRVLEALCEEKLGRPKAALEKLSAALAAAPLEADLLQARAALLRRMSKHEAALADYNETIRLRPDESSNYLLRAELLLQLGKKGEAKRDLLEAVKLGVPQGQVQAMMNKCK